MAPQTARSIRIELISGYFSDQDKQPQRHMDRDICYTRINGCKTMKHVVVSCSTRLKGFCSGDGTRHQCTIRVLYGGADAKAF
jgi:hypothetical protein